MSDAAAASGTAEPQPARVLTLQTEGTTRLTAPLADAGYRVDSIARVSDLEETLRGGQYDAVILDMAARNPEDALLAEVGRLLEKPPARADRARPASRPLLLALSPGGEPPGGGPVAPDQWLTAQGTDQVVKEIDGAIAVRRLAEALAAIERLQRAVLFARQTAHELAQPLTTIAARAQLLMLALKPQDPHYRAVSIICREADRMAQMVEQFKKLRALALPPDLPGV